MLLLSLAVVYHGNTVNERAERLLWRSLLQSELDHYLARHREDPDYHWRDTEDVTLYDSAEPRALPPRIAGLAPGLHDEIKVDGRERVVLVKDVEGRRFVVALDITGFEDEERHLTTLMVGSALGGLLVAGILVAWGLRRMTKPLATLASDIAALQPDRPAQRIAPGRRASSELVVIADAVNGYVERNARFVERERAFIDSASHELRTPIAVIAGASEIALEQLAPGQAGAPAATRQQLQRILHTARGVEQLISLLLVLAKDPQRLARSSDRFRLDQLLPEIVEDHRHLCADKNLTLELAPLPPCEVIAPLAIVQAAVGNLLRNAIENSDRGSVAIALLPGAVVVIDDPGHGMTPEEISAIYARMARGGGREGSGIGLELIARLCEHLGWHLRIAPRAERGTRVTLDLGRALARGGEGPAGG
ncbi:sensor histidine kinase [Luteimonas aquatica]|uniref:sensor histidine kinase n=1 Tax=Luteimonas aquatica TaxID=450364 RepID=UPI001F5685E8|nr:HAMP domain-containing sensor histidine kinase [Luteimonas aquatica]